MRPILRSLETPPLVSIYYGHFLTNPIRMHLANPVPGRPRPVEVIKTEEKGSDVNLASCLLVDAFQKACEVAVAISNDSDLRIATLRAEQELGVTVGIINPKSVGPASDHAMLTTPPHPGYRIAALFTIPLATPPLPSS